MYFETFAVILSSEPSGEFDYIVHLLCGRRGLVTARLQSARKAGSRLKILKEPGVYAALHLWSRDQTAGTICRLLTGQVLEIFPQARCGGQTLEWLIVALNFARTFLTPFDMRAGEKMSLVLETLAKLNSMNVELPATMLGYKLKMLELSGWKLSKADTGLRFLDTNSRRLCAALEEGRPLGEPRQGAGRPLSPDESLTIEKIEKGLALYAENLAGTPSRAARE
ncbi:MAG: recombination protein O N-terminal domain-containing protein [Elusimicrobia bacterium]|nr:recombination protein O N-terminal domain-containing protein [Elusimicrobiota bacterium]